MKEKLVFLDIDGTLTVAGQNVPPDSALQAIREAQANGHKVFLCTGRNPAMLAPLLEYGFDGIIASSGGIVACGNEVIFDCPMSNEQRDRAMTVLKDSGVFRTVEGRDGSFTDEGFKEYIRTHSGSGANSEYLRWREAIEKELNIKPMSEYAGQPIYKMVFMSPSAEALDNARAQLGDFTWYVQDPNELGIINGELVTNNFNKGEAVRRVSEYTGIPMENTVGFGDSANDLEMIEVVAQGVCMENGSEVLKEKADFVCPPVGEDGLYKGFVACGLIESN